MRLANFPFTLPHQLYSPELQVSWTLSPPPISALIPWLIYLRPRSRGISDSQFRLLFKVKVFL